MVIMDENEEYSQIIGNPSAPYLNSLAANYTSATNWYSIEHISGADYRDLVSGYDNQPGSTPTIVDELNKAGIPWKAYMESMPSNCYTGSQSPDYTYDAHHNPLQFLPQLQVVLQQSRDRRRRAVSGRFGHGLDAGFRQPAGLRVADAEHV